MNDSENLMDAPTQLPTFAPRDAAAFEEDEGGLPVVPGYEIVREIGRGGMGVVYLAKQISLDRLVALKTIQPRGEKEFAELLVSEAHIVGKLNHPAIVPVFEASTSGNVWYFSMELVQGKDLAHRLSQAVLSVSDVVRLAKVLCDALEHAHENGILHLDIKPANILIGSNGQPKLTDFGLSAIHAAKMNEKQVMGTPQFMAPEQALSATSDICAATDIYSLGAVMYAALVGRPPIVSADPQELILKLISQPPASMRQLSVRVPRPLEAIVMKCLEKRPQQRYATAKELKSDLEAFTSGQPVKARPPSIWASAEYQLRKHVLAASVSGSAVLLLLLLACVLIVRWWSQSNEMLTLQNENDRLKHLIAYQYELMRGRLNKDDVAVKLAEKGDVDRAAFFAAEALLENDDVGNRDELQKLVKDYAERNAMQTGASDTELLQRVIAAAEQRQSALMAGNTKASDDAESTRTPKSGVEPKDAAEGSH